MTIAVDFDGTIVEHKYPAIGRVPQWRICSGWPVLIPIHFLFIYPSRMVCARMRRATSPNRGGFGSPLEVNGFARGSPR